MDKCILSMHRHALDKAVDNNRLSIFNLRIIISKSLFNYGMCVRIYITILFKNTH